MSEVENEADEVAESEAEEAADQSATEEVPDAGRDEIWIEKYRPERLDEVAGHDDITARLSRYVERDDLPNLLFSGPAGVGKCVTGDTPVLTNRGVEQIESVVGDAEGFDKPDDGLEVLTFDEQNGFDYTEPSHVFGKQTDELVEIETRDGSEMAVTPEHRLSVLTQNGLEWRQAENLQEGDRVARPLRTPTSDRSSGLDWLQEMDGDRTLVHVTEEFAADHEIPAEENWVGTKKSVFRGLRRGESIEKIVEDLDTPRKTVQTYRREAEDINLDVAETICSLSFLRELDCSRDELQKHVRKVQYVTRYNQRSPSANPPWSVTPQLARFVGLAVSEARIENGRIKFYNSDEELLRQFEHAATEVFDAEVKEGTQKGVPYREVNTRTVTHLLDSCFGVFSSDGIGSSLVTADEESRAAFLQSVFDAEAHVTKNGIIELTQKDEQLITLLSYLLTSFGVPSRRKTDNKRATNGSDSRREYHTLYVSGGRNLARFEEAIGFTMDEKASRLRSAAAKSRNPNHDTMVVQDAVDELSEQLYLEKGALLTETLNPESPGRENYLEDLDRVLDAAAAKLETAQEVLQQLDEVSSQVEAVDKTPAAWVGEREQLEPLETRKEVASETGIRSDSLLEYADGRRTPTAARAGQLLVEVESLETEPPVERIQNELTTAVEELNVPYERLADGTQLRGTDVINLLENEGHDLKSLSRFSTITDRVRDVASEMLSELVLESIHTLDTIATADLYYDTVESVEPITDERRVYDLTVPETRNYVAGTVPTVMHNTTSAVSIARELYGDDWQQNFLELNASDQRGIDVVRDRIKNFARSSFGGHNYRIIFLDEADSLTSDAQSALRRTMEQFSNNTRFILSCNYSSKIIDPIQSRCATFRFGPIDDEGVTEQILEVAEEEGIETTEAGIDALVYAADGDMRKAINALQAAAVMGEVVDEEAVFSITSTARPEEIEEMVRRAIDGEFSKARRKLDEMLTEKGMAGGDIIDQLHRSVWEFDLDDEATVRLMDRVGEVDYRISEGANERVQLEALLASLSLEDR